MRHEYDRPLLLLNLISARTRRLFPRAVTHILFVSFVDQTAQQALRMIDDVGGGPAERGRRVVSKGEYAGILDFVRQEVFEPELVRPGMCPGFDGVAAQAVHSYYARARSARSAPRSTTGTLGQGRRHMQMTLTVCGVMLTRAYMRWSFPEVDARVRATSRDETVVRRGKEETCMLGQEK